MYSCVIFKTSSASGASQGTLRRSAPEPTSYFHPWTPLGDFRLPDPLICPPLEKILRVPMSASESRSKKLLKDSLALRDRAFSAHIPAKTDQIFIRILSQMCPLTVKFPLNFGSHPDSGYRLALAEVCALRVLLFNNNNNNNNQDKDHDIVIARDHPVHLMNAG